ncbi:MAG: TetR family transcriptional regulator [Chloroflexota bacterium]
MRRTKEEAAKTRQDLLDAALETFSVKGYQATRLQDIAKAAGTTRGAIYHHFENKAALYKTLAIEANQLGNEMIANAVSEGGSFREICQRIFINGLKLIEQNERFQQVMALSLYKTGVSDELAEIEEMRLTSAVTTIEQMVGMFQMGVAGGDLRQDIDLHTIARTFIAFQNGAAWLWLNSGQNFSLSEAAPKFADILFTGIGSE